VLGAGSAAGGTDAESAHPASNPTASSPAPSSGNAFRLTQVREMAQA
jgi:hypothetical protein